MHLKRSMAEGEDFVKERKGKGENVRAEGENFASVGSSFNGFPK